MSKKPQTIEDMITAMPRRPAAILLTQLERRFSNVPSLSIPTGDRMTMLSQHGLARLNALSFAPSAVRWMEDNAQSRQQAQAGLLDNATLAFIGHLNNTPPGFRLVVEAARPADEATYKADTRHFEQHRSKYLRFLAGLAKRSPDHFTSVALRHHPKSGSRQARDSTVLRIGAGQIAQLEKGSAPEGWSVEHIKARSYDSERLKNSFRNLILMPTSYNEWTARLEALQHSVLFKPGQDNPRRLIIMAEPVRSAPQGHFVYGAQRPVDLDRREIAALLDREIGSLAGPANTKPKARAHTRWSRRQAASPKPGHRP